MASIAENLRATLLSLKQISDRVKSLILTSVTKSELNSAKQEVLTAVEDIDIDLTPVEGKVDEVSDKIDDIKDTFDADMALQLQGIIGDSEESVESNSQTEGEIERLRTLQESYDALSRNEIDMNVVNIVTAEVNNSKQNIIDLLAHYGVSADMTMSLDQLAAKVDSLVSFVPFGTEVLSMTFRNAPDTTSINLSGIRVDYSSSWGQKLYQFTYMESFIVGGNLYLPNVTSFSNMISGAIALLYADLRGLSFSSSLTDMSNFLNNCTSLTTLYLGSGFSGNHITNFYDAFNRCSALQIIDIENLTTDYATNLTAMFSGCSSLISLDLSHFNTNIVTNMISTFSNCSLLAKLNLIGWSAAALTTSTQMFFYSTLLETLVGDTTYENVVANDIKILDQYNVTTNTYISGAANLNRASLRAWINGLKDLTGQSAKTLTIGTTLKNKLSAEDIAVATNKNWVIS